MSNLIYGSTEYAKLVNGTYRATGSVGPKAVVPKYVRAIAFVEDRILDFGAGRSGLHARQLREVGYHVDAYDIGNNVSGLHLWSRPGIRDYDIVYASNVLNVQPSEELVRKVLGEIKSYVKPFGKVVLNYPKEPRYSNLTTDEFVQILHEFWAELRKSRVSATMWEVWD